ncbi:hypothetical protein NGRA_0858 [Nosema granulosis]|uniref:Uncharacterized protein n=1 Tax=Nosema granulosis TaxID=83296 RepID=A0A9P6KZN3_9MICR|nr:hypothetical protein NGRA_0858 [Nosema granulosis]
MENLLFEILRSPVESTINKLEDRLNLEEGACEFLMLLKSNNVIAFTYMKMKIKDWSTNNRRLEMLGSNQGVFFGLVDSCTEQNLELYCDTLEAMSLKDIVWVDFIDFLVQKDGPRSFRVLNSLFKKFRILKRSDKLYTEIISSILKTGPLFTKYYLSTPPSTNLVEANTNLLEMFFSLVYQDIHPFFEDNSASFFSSFVALYRVQELQGILSEIYNLFILKYPECVDMTQILGSVLSSITKYDYIKYQILLNITRRKNVHAVSKFKDIVIKAIQIGAYLSDKEKEEMNDNTLEYTRSILKNQDNYRGMVSEIIEHCKSMFGEGWCAKLLASTTDSEMLVFFHLSLKFRDERILKECKMVARSTSADVYLSVVSFRYLIFSGEYDFIDVGYISSKHPGRYFSIFLLKGFFDRQFSIKDIFLRQIDYNSTTSINTTATYGVLVVSTIKFIISNIEDEYSSALLLSLIKYEASLMTKPLYASLVEYLKTNVRNINSVISYSYLFDVLGLVYLQEKDDTAILELSDIILQEDIVDMYSSIFHLLAIVVKLSTKDLSGLLQIISVEKLWTAKELRLSLVCLSGALYSKGYCTREQIDYIIAYLSSINKYYSYILIDNTLLSPIPEDTDIEEQFINSTVLAKNNIIDREKYKALYCKILGYLLNNFITRKNVRRVLRALMEGSKIVGSLEYVKEIIEKNSINIGYENVPISTFMVFDI